MVQVRSDHIRKVFTPSRISLFHIPSRLPFIPISFLFLGHVSPFLTISKFANGDASQTRYRGPWECKERIERRRGWRWVTSDVGRGRCKQEGRWSLLSTIIAYYLKAIFFSFSLYFHGNGGLLGKIVLDVMSLGANGGSTASKITAINTSRTPKTKFSEIFIIKPALSHKRPHIHRIF